MNLENVASRINNNQYYTFSGVSWGWALIRGWALINFFCLLGERLFEVGANSRLVAYSNKYGILIMTSSGNIPQGNGISDVFLVVQ